MALHDLGRHEEFDQVMTRLVDRWGQQWPTDVAAVYAWAGQADEAFSWLDKAAESGGLVNIQTDYPELTFDKIRGDDRWLALMERIGRSPAQLGDFEFAVRLPE